VRELKKEKYILSSEVVTVGSYDFCHPCDGTQNSHLFLKWPSVHNELDMSDIHKVNLQLIKIKALRDASYHKKKKTKNC
jgi:hypothetical protein